MSDLVNVQKEFEELIEQLEKLKKVNQITSANAENTENIISEIQAFTIKINSFVDKISENHNEIGHKVKSVINALEKGIEDYKVVNIETKTLITKKLSNIEEGLNGIKELEEKGQKSTIELIDEKFSKITENLTAINDEQNLIQENQVNSENNLKLKIDSLNDQLSSFKTKVNNKLLLQGKGIQVLKTLMIITLIIIIVSFLTIIFLIS